MTEQNTFGDRLAALTEAIAARPDALAEDHLTYAEFLLSGERTLEAIVGEVREDERIGAWHQVASHPLLKSCYDEDDTLIDAIIRRMDELHARETATEKAVLGTPAHLIGEAVTAEDDHTYPVGSRAKDRDDDLWEKKEDGWWYLGKGPAPGWPDNTPWKYNARFIA